MGMFAITTLNQRVVNKFMAETHERLKECSITKNPYTGKVIKIKSNYSERITYIVDMTPLYPPFYLGGGFAIMLNIVFFRWWLLAAGLFIFSLGLFWSNLFLSFMLRLGLRKAGYNGPINVITNKKKIDKILLMVI